MTHDELLQQLTERIRIGRPTNGPDPLAPPPATREAVAEAEQALGRPLPDLLRRIYLEVADGGIGPGFGILGLTALIAENSIQWPDDPDPEDPPKPPHDLLFLADWGCANWSMIDCREPGGGIWAWEEGNRWAHGWSLAQWLEAWLNDGVRMPCDMHDVRLVGHPDEWFRPDDEDDQDDDWDEEDDDSDEYA